MFNIVRPSKYRHVYGTAYKRDESYENLRISLSAWDTNFVSVNPKYLAANWNAGGGGAFCVVPLDMVGKLRGDFPLFSAHSGAVLDTAFSPFDDDIIASAAEDHKAMVWRVPEDLAEREEDVTEPLLVLSGHGRKVGHVAWNPVAEGVLAVSSSDYTVKLWDVQQGEVKQTLQGFKDNILSMAWNHNGSLLAATCRDKQLRVFDARSGQVVQQGDGHQGVKGSRVAWLGTEPRLVTTGFARTSDRQVYVWNSEDLSKPISKLDIDLSSGMLMPFYDSGSNMLYVAGKGDGNIRYYEFENDTLHYLSEYQSPEPQRGLNVMPKRGCDVKKCEVMRFFKVSSNSLVEPISFRVPRKAETFQSDIYPPAHGGKPALSAAQYFDGENAEPVTLDLESVFENGPATVGSKAAMASVAAPAPAVAVVAAAAAAAAAPSPIRSSPAVSASPATPAPKSPAPPTPAAPQTQAQLPKSPAPVQDEEVQLRETKAEAAAAVAAAAASNAEADRLRETNAELQARLDAAEQKLTEASQAVAQLEKSLQDQRGQATSLSTKLSSVSDELSGAQKQASDAQAREQDAQSKLKQAAEDADKLSAQLDKASAQAEEYKAQLQKAEERVKEQEHINECIQKELQSTIVAANSLALAAEKAADALQ